MRSQSDATTPHPEIDETVVAPSESTDASRSLAPNVSVVEGTSPHFSAITQSLLRLRLRMAAFALAASYGVFLLFHLWQYIFRYTEGDSFELLLFHCALVAMLLLMGLYLCPKCDNRKPLLYMQEALIFGASAVFTFWIQFNAMGECTASNHMIHSPAPIWLLLIFTYALFIPNKWPRAAVVIGAMAIAPALVMAIGWFAWPDARLAIANNVDMVGKTVLVMLVCSSVAVFGVYTINRLRSEAFRAKQLGQYHLRKMIGSGGMGEVYLAEHTLMKRPCAIKLIRPEKGADGRVLARFEREVRLSSKLSHWNNIDIYDYGRTADGTFYYVMEFLPGLSVSDLVKQYGPMSPQRAIYLMSQTCEALSEAHTKGLVHRDIKPANVFAAQRGGHYDVAKLLDFGLAKPIQAGEEDAQLTQEGSITGSPLFMSPEQASGEHEPDARGDIYSLGALMYFMLTGQAPFNYDRPIKVIIAHAHERPIPPSQVNPDIPSDLDAVVLRCLEKQPQDRYQTAVELAEALDRCEAAGQWNRRLAQQWWNADERRIPVNEEEVFA
ncbi:serine/threonine protein kinase [Blastopirellula sp. JC732]|uniref:non-specific serine/threonine protein kinase n=1 Tax=Blastopirellula sediminis TaxID=2894196 RepID=A0A9X1MT93_9BACT|nr:serine/threonine-protein kinase [Blastopirellula sediminis]MCC9604629.1 serine/threonine protein kinase [Blastopirellula sediminis]MCC9632072.1 serine/threonine protein kinase [Blastopirellula sediminis]